MKAIRIYGWLSLLLPTLAVGQNSMTSSPYSMFGIGEITTGLNGANAGMGGVAIGTRDHEFINPTNPAGLTALDSCRLYAELSAFARFEDYHSGNNRNTSFVGNFSGLALAGRIMPRWYAAARLSPYSVVGYYFKSHEEMEGSPGTYYISAFTGDGGLSLFQISNALQLTPALSVGVNAGFLFGKIENSESQSEQALTENLSGQGWTIDFGTQYTRQLGKELFLTIGASYTWSGKIRMTHERTLSTTSSGATIDKGTETWRLPQRFGFGISVGHKQMTYALDYQYIQYGRLRSSDSRFTFNDTHEIRLGSCYEPNGYSSSPLWEKMVYKLGLVFSTPYYMNIRGQSGRSWRATLGVGFPVLNGRIHTSVFHERATFGGTHFHWGITGLVLTYTMSELFHHVKL